MSKDIPFVFEFCETARTRMAEHPLLAVHAKLLEEALKLTPNQSGREVSDGIVRYKPFKEYLWCYILSRNETAVTCTVLTIDMLHAPDLSSRLGSSVWAAVQELSVFAKMANAATDRWRAQS